MPNNKLLVLVTDGSKARIFNQENRSAPYTLNHDLTQDLPETGDHDAGKPGRSFESGNSVRHAYEPKTDWHDHQKELFVKSLADLFIKEHQATKFHTAYIICPPKLIQFLRTDIHNYVHKLPTPDKPIDNEITKDLTHLKAHELEKLINGL